MSVLFYFPVSADPVQILNWSKMGSQDGPEPPVHIVAKSESPSRSDEPAAKRVKLDPDAAAAVEPVVKEPRVKVKGYALIKEEYVELSAFPVHEC